MTTTTDLLRDAVDTVELGTRILEAVAPVMCDSLGKITIDDLRSTIENTPVRTVYVDQLLTAATALLHLLQFYDGAKHPIAWNSQALQRMRRRSESLSASYSLGYDMFRTNTAVDAYAYAVFADNAACIITPMRDRLLELGVKG